MVRFGMGNEDEIHPGKNAAGAMLGRGQGARVAVRIPVVFVAIHFGFAWGFWKEVAKQVRLRVQSRSASPQLSQPAGPP